MKKSILVLAGALAFIASAPQASFALPQASSQDDSQQAASQMRTPDQVVAMLDSKLSLSADQKTKITPIIADRQQKLKALAADQSTRRMQKSRKMKSIFEESDDKIKALLPTIRRRSTRRFRKKCASRSRSAASSRAPLSNKCQPTGAGIPVRANCLFLWSNPRQDRAK